jgi:SAM-dependent methyltransferase
MDRRLKRLTSLCCDGCGLVRTDPMPTDAELDAYYRREYRQDYQLAGARPSPRHIGVSLREAERRLAMLAPHLAPGARVMDFGAGSAEFVKAAADAGFDTLGVEPGESFANFARQTYGVRIVGGRHQDIDFPAESFDLITSHHVIEHLRDPISMLARFAEWLRPGGLAYIAVPDITNSGKPVFERFHFAHLYNFAPSTLVSAALKAGLEPDPRFPPAGTVIVFRKDRQGASVWAPDPAVAVQVRTALPHTSVARHVLTGAWLRPMLNRARKYAQQARQAAAA